MPSSPMPGFPVWRLECFGGLCVRKLAPPAPSTDGTLTSDSDEILAIGETVCAPSAPVTSHSDNPAEEHVIRRFRTQKTAALLALLALRGAQGREGVCALLWPDAAPEAARNSLSAALSALRRELGDETFVADRHRVALRAGVLTTDVDAFDAALKAGDWAAAVELYSGHLLPGFHEDPFPALEGEYTEKARGAFLSRVEELESGSREALGGMSPDTRLEELRKAARRAILLFGDEERWFLALMRAHQMAGDVDAALRAYSSLQRHLRKDGELASEATRQLAKELRRQKEALASAAPPPSTLPPWSAPLPDLGAESKERDAAGNTPLIVETASHIATSLPLPPQWTRFFGREDERDLLRDWLGQSGNLVTLSGPGGSGKTRLSLETLQELGEPHGASTASDALLSGGVTADAGTLPRFTTFFVPLASLTEAELLHQGIRDALGLSAAPNLSPLDQIERALRGGRHIVFLDNLEQLLPQAAPKLQALRERLPQTTFLVTSRVLLNLPGEREFPVSPLPTPLPRTSVGEVRTYPSVALFCDRAGLVLNESNAEAVGTLCRRLDGIPLALELAAARAKVLSPAQIVEKLASRPDFLQSRELGVPSRHRTLYATIEWSTDLLSPELRAFFLKLSIFRGGWTLEAAEDVCQEPDALEFLTYLRESSLLAVEEHGGESRFQMLETIREFGQERLDAGARASGERALFNFFLDLAQHAAGAMRGPEQTAWLHRLDAEQDNLRTALAWARDHDAQRGLLLATALIEFWETRLSLDEGRQWIETFLSATAPPPMASSPAATLPTVSAPSPRATSSASPLVPSPEQEPGLEVRSRALSGAGRLAWYAKDYDGATTLIEQGLEAAQQSGNPAALIDPARNAARLAPLQSDVTRAGELGRESVRLSRESGDQAALLASLVDNAAVTIVSGDYPATRQLCTEGVTLARSLGDIRALAMMLYLEAIAEFYDGRYEHARPLVEESAALCRRAELRWDLMVALGVLASVQREAGELPASARHFAQCLAICREAALADFNVIHLLLSASYLLVRLGEVPVAVQVMGACEAGSQAIGYTLIAPMVTKDGEFRAEARAALGEAEFAASWQRGRLLTMAQALDLALERLHAFASSPDGMVPPGISTSSDANDSSDIPASSDVSASLLTTRSRALSGASRLTWMNRETETSRAWIEESLAAARQTGDAQSFVYAASALVRLALSTGAESDLSAASQLSREATQQARMAAALDLLLEALLSQGYAQLASNHLEGVRALHVESLGLARELGDEQKLARVLTSFSSVALPEGKYAEAHRYLDESVRLSRRLNSFWDLMAARWMSAVVACEEDRLEVAAPALREALQICREHTAILWGCCNVLSTAAQFFSRQGEWTRAVQIMGAVHAHAAATNYRIIPCLQPNVERYETLARAALGPSAFEAAWEGGHLLSSDQALDLAMQWLVLTPSEGDSSNEAPDAALVTRSRALSGAGRLAWHDGDFAASQELVEEGLSAARASGDLASFVYAVLAFVRFAQVNSDVARHHVAALELAQEAVERSRAAGDAALLLPALNALCNIRVSANQLAQLRPLAREAVSLARASGDGQSLIGALTTAGSEALYVGEPDEALPFFVEGVQLSRQLNLPWHLMSCSWGVASSRRALGQLAAAIPPLREALQICAGYPTIRWEVPLFLLSTSYLRYQSGDAAGAAQLMGASEALRETLHSQTPPVMAAEYERFRALVRADLDETTYQTAWKQGRRLSAPTALELALRVLEAPIAPDQAKVTNSGITNSESPDSELVSSESSTPDDILTVRARALSGAGRLAWHKGDFEGARQLVESGLDAARQAGDTTSFVYAVVAFVRFAIMDAAPQHLVRAALLSEEAVTRSREANDRELLLQSLNSLGYSRVCANQLEGVTALLEEAEEIARALGDSLTLAFTLNVLGAALHFVGDAVGSRRLYADATQISRNLDMPLCLMSSLWGLATTARELRDWPLATDALRESIEVGLAHESIRWQVAHQLLSVAYLRTRRGDALGAAQVMGAAAAMRETLNYQLPPIMVAEHDFFRAETVTALSQNASGKGVSGEGVRGEGPKGEGPSGEAAFAEAWQRGQSLNADEAVALALEVLVAPVAGTPPTAVPPFTVTPSTVTPSAEANVPDTLERTAVASPVEVEDLTKPTFAIPDLVTRARALSGAGRLAWHGGDVQASRALVEDGLSVARASGDIASFVYAVAAFVNFSLTSNNMTRDMPIACRLAEEAVQRSREAGRDDLLLQALTALSYALMCVNDQRGASASANEAAMLARACGDEQTLSHALIVLASALHFGERYAEGRAVYEQSTQLSRQLGLPWNLLASLWGLSNSCRELGDLTASEVAIRESLQVCRANSGIRWYVVQEILSLAYLLMRFGEATHAALLMGAGEAAREVLQFQLAPSLATEYDRYYALLSTLLDAEALQLAWQQGRRMSPEAAIDLALEARDQATRQAAATAAESDTLTVQPNAALASRAGKAQAGADVELTVRARALSGASRLAWHNGDFAATRDLMEQSLEAARQTGDVASFVGAIGAFGRFAMTSSDADGDIARALTLSEEAVQLARTSGDGALLLEALTSLCFVRVTCGNDIESLQPVHTEAIALAKELEDPYGLVRMYVSAASTEYYQGQYETARAFLDECLPLCRELNSPWDVRAVFWVLASVAREQGQLEVACAAVVECLDISRENSAMRWGVANMLLSAGYLLLRCGDAMGTIVLMGASQGLCETLGYHMAPTIESERLRFEAQARQQLSDSRFATAWQRGLLMSPERAMDYAERAVEKAMLAHSASGEDD